MSWSHAHVASNLVVRWVVRCLPASKRTGHRAFSAKEQNRSLVLFFWKILTCSWQPRLERREMMRSQKFSPPCEGFFSVRRLRASFRLLRKKDKEQGTEIKARKRCTAIKLAVVFAAKKNGISRFVKRKENLLCRGCYCAQKRRKRVLNEANEDSGSGWFEFSIFSAYCSLWNETKTDFTRNVH